jgi:predicted nuclease with TOPRIM domain
MFGILTRKQTDAYIAEQIKQMEAERWLLENEQDKLKAKLKDLQERVAILEDRHLGGLMTPKEVDEKMQKRIEANRYARSQYRKRKEKNASNRTPSI